MQPRNEATRHDSKRLCVDIFKSVRNVSVSISSTCELNYHAPVRMRRDATIKFWSVTPKPYNKVSGSPDANRRFGKKEVLLYPAANLFHWPRPGLGWTTAWLSVCSDKRIADNLSVAPMLQKPRSHKHMKLKILALKTTSISVLNRTSRTQDSWTWRSARY